MRENKTAKQAAVLLWIRLARTYGRLSQAAMHDLRARGLTMAQFDVIAQVGSSPGMTQDELAKRLLVTKGNVTQLLSRMEDKGWVQRQRDARCNRVMLTDAGMRLFQDTVPQHETFMASQFAGLTGEERSELAALLRKLARTLPEETR